VVFEPFLFDGEATCKTHLDVRIEWMALITAAF
jgi:hypothetical protein